MMSGAFGVTKAQDIGVRSTQSPVDGSCTHSGAVVRASSQMRLVLCTSTFSDSRSSTSALTVADVSSVTVASSAGRKLGVGRSHAACGQ